MSATPLPFAMQRIVFFGLLFGMTAYAIAAAIMLQQNGGHGLGTAPVPWLDDAALQVGIVSAVLALLLRVGLGFLANRRSGARRAGLLFHRTLVPLILLEGGCLTGITAWLINGNAVPALAVALVLLAFAIAIVPFQDPNARQP